MCVAVFLLIETGIVQRWVRQIVVSQIEQHTGARVELGGFHLHIWQLRAELDDLTLHGLEAAGTPPLFHAAHVNVAIHILSFIGKEIAIDELVFDQPQLAVRIDKNGKSNVPTPRVPGSKRPWRETLFSLRIGHLELRDGSATFNDRSAPLAMLGKDLQFQLHLNGASSPGTESYVGNLQWQQIELAAQTRLAVSFRHFREIHFASQCVRARRPGLEAAAFGFESSRRASELRAIGLEPCIIAAG